MTTSWPTGFRWIDLVQVDDAAVAAVGGNASYRARKEVLQAITGVPTGRRLYADFSRRIRVTRVDVQPNPNEPSRVSGRAVAELVVGPEMVDENQNVTVPTLALLVDILSTLALVAQGAEQNRPGDYVGVTQSLQMVFHATAPLGTTLRIDNTCIALGGRALTARCEVWDATTDRLLCSGFHVKMAPSSKL